MKERDPEAKREAVLDAALARKAGVGAGTIFQRKPARTETEAIMMKNDVDEHSSRNGGAGTTVKPVVAVGSTRACAPATNAGFAGSILLTGPTGGLGGALLEEIVRRRPEHLILLGRASPQFEAAEAVARKGGVPAVSLIHVDLADLDDVARAGLAVRHLVADGRPSLTSVIFSAGMQTTDRRHVNAQGLELTFAVNVVASHLLLRTVLPGTAPIARVTLVGSGTHFGNWHSYGMVPPPRWQDPVELVRPDTDESDPDPAAGPRAYATSKLGVLYLAHAWQTRHPEQLRVNVFDPGLMPGTGLAREQHGATLWAWKHVMPAFSFLPGWSTPRASAARLAALVLGEQYSDVAGGYVEIGHIKKSSAESYDTERETRLWEVCETLVAAHAGPGTQGLDVVRSS